MYFDKKNKIKFKKSKIYHTMLSQKKLHKKMVQKSCLKCLKTCPVLCANRFFQIHFEGKIYFSNSQALFAR